MIFELVHTYAERGLRGEPAGFATVAATAGIPAPAAAAAESLSGHALGRDRRAATALRGVEAGGRPYLLYSRTRPCASTPKGLPNRLAHHLVIDLSAGLRCDLAAIVGSWRFREAWDAAPLEWPSPPAIPTETPAPAPCEAWAAAAGDAGWAGVVLERLGSLEDQPLSVLLGGSVDAARLASELLRLLPQEERPSATFSDRPQPRREGVSVRLLLLDEETLAAFGPPPPPGPAVLDLRDRRPAGGSAAAAAAREGRLLAAAAAPPRLARFGSVEDLPQGSEPAPAEIGPIEVRLEESPRRLSAVLLAIAAIAAAAAVAWLALSGGEPTR